MKNLSSYFPVSLSTMS